MKHTDFYSKILMLDISKSAAWDFQFQQDFQSGITRVVPSNVCKILMLDISKSAAWDFQFQQDFQSGITRF